MLRSARFAAVAIGLIALVGEPHDTRAQEQDQPQTEQMQIPPPLFGLTDQAHKPDQLTAPCEPGSDNRNSDLCAQWKAADAANQSAYWSGPTYRLGVAGIGIGLFTLAAAVAAAIFTGQTVVVTRKIGEAQTRAYINVINVKANVADGGSFEIEFTVKNFGQSPARFLHCVFAVFDGGQVNSNGGKPPYLWVGSGVFHIAAGQEKEIPRHRYANIKVTNTKKSSVGKIAVFGKDVHDREIFETFYFSTIPDIEGAQAGQFSTIMNDSMEYANIIPDSIFEGRGWHGKWLRENCPKRT